MQNNSRKYEIKTTPSFTRSYKRYKKKHFPMASINDCLQALINNDQGTLLKHKDHQLKGTEYRELHIDRQYNDDWLLVYKIDPSQEIIILMLVDMGSHDDLNRIV